MSSTCLSELIVCHVSAKLRMTTQAGGCPHKVTQCRTRQLGYGLFSLALRLGLKIIDMACTIRRRSWKLVTIVMLCFVVMIVHHLLRGDRELHVRVNDLYRVRIRDKDAR